MKFFNNILYLIAAKRLYRKPIIGHIFKIIPSKLLRKIYYRVQNQVKPTYDIGQKKYIIPFVNETDSKGVNVIGFARYDLGLAEACRAVALSIENANIPVCVINDDRCSYPSTNTRVDHLLKNEALYNVNIFANNLDISFKARKKLKIPDEQLLDFYSKYNICYGFWEFPEMPESWISNADFFDEIWVPTRFVQDVFSRYTRTPVIYMPQAIDFKIEKLLTRADFKIPENKFLFMFSFDLFSFNSRKNARAVIDAFKLAFSKDQKNVALIIKTNNSNGDLVNQSRFDELIKTLDIPEEQICTINSNLSRDEMYNLINLCDCYISLHRTEGLGLGMAEAMKLGKPVIATGYSGNTDFMNHNNSFLVDYRLVKATKDDYEFLKKDSVWAEANIEHAAQLMKHVLNDEADRNLKAKAGKAYIDENNNLEKIGELYRKRLEILGLI